MDPSHPSPESTQSVFSVLPDNAVVELQQGGLRFDVQWRSHPAGSLPEKAAHYFFVADQSAEVSCKAGVFRAQSGMYGCLPGEGRISVEDSAAVLIVSCRGHDGVFLLGGPVERLGRLRYIDGCTDSLLAPPLLRGDPCLNYLHIPPGVDQTPHTHPSFRLGVVLRGAGVCRTAEGDHAMTPGSCFLIAADGRHSFHTADEELAVVAFHPDSDFGPTHEDHPMLNRTVVDGVTASMRRVSGDE